MNFAFLCVTVSCLPLLVPSGPGSTAPVDAVAVTFLLVTITTAIVRRRHVSMPAFAPVLLILTVSSVPVLVSVAPGTGLLSLLIEAYLVVLMWAVCTQLRGSPDQLGPLLTVWVVASLGWAALLIGVHVHALPGELERLLVSNSSSARAAGAARNPNLAASYLVTSLFVLWASPWPRRWLLRTAAATWLIVAVVITGSNAALIGIAVGGLVLLASAVRRRAGAAGRMALAGLLALGAAVGVVAVATHPPNQATVAELARSQHGGLLASDLGRLNTSVSTRVDLWSSAVHGGLADSVIGVGPGEAATITVDGEPLGKSLHDDYLAFLLERGVLGLLALMLFIGVMVRWALPLLGAGTQYIHGARWRPGGLAAAGPANLAISLTHESYHFRHVWVLLALMWVARQALPREEPMSAPSPAELPRDELSHALV